MKTNLIRIRKVISLLTFVAIVHFATAQDQKAIVISDSLTIRADEFPVKVGAQWMGKIYKFKFGEYSVGDSKMGWSTSTQKAKMFDRKTESSSKQKYFFELNGSTNDVARVNAANKIESKALREWTYLSYSTGNFRFSVDEDAELLMEENSYSAFISINNDTTEVWSLIMTTFKGSLVNENYKPVALLSNGVRKIYLVPVTSSENGKNKRVIPAYGYELQENGLGLAALQFYGGGTLGMNRNIIWLPRDVEPKMKLLLAAVLTAVLQNKIGSIGF